MSEKKLQTPFRYDFVGSFLRPQSLKDARRSFEQGKISADELKQVEDEAIRDLVSKQKKAGYHTLTDGEFRRATWHLDFMWDWNGVEHEIKNGNSTFEGEVAKIDDVHISGKISVRNHPFVEHFKFVQSYEDENTVAKQTIPAPGQFYAQFTGSQELENTLHYYPTLEAFADDVVEGYNEFIREIYAAGCRNLQFDDCTWGGFVNPQMATRLTGKSAEDLPRYMDLLIDINNRVIDAAPKDLIINTHICRGNYHSTYFSSGAYDSVAEYVFAKEHVHAFFLEFDDPKRDGSFKPLAFVPEDKIVVLGLVTTKSPALEDPEIVRSRLKEASEIIPLDRLALSPQCGFASTEIGNKLTEDDEWKKLKLVKDIAEDVFGDWKF